MPAHHTEVDEAEEEGVKLELLCAPVRIVTDAASKATGIEMQRVSSVISMPPVGGAPCPSPGLSSSSSAIRSSPLSGSSRCSTAPARSRASNTPGGTLSRSTIGPSRQVAGSPGGDAVLGAQTAIQAIAQGKKAAWSMDAFLRGGDLEEASRSLSELKAMPFFNALSAKTDLDPRIARMAEIPPVFIDMTTDEASRTRPRRCRGSRQRSARRTSARSSSRLQSRRGRTRRRLCLDCTARKRQEHRNLRVEDKNIATIALEIRKAGFVSRTDSTLSREQILTELAVPTASRVFLIRLGLEKGLTPEEIAKVTGFDPWFLNNMKEIRRLRPRHHP